MTHRLFCLCFEGPTNPGKLDYNFKALKKCFEKLLKIETDFFQRVCQHYLIWKPNSANVIKKFKKDPVSYYNEKLFQNHDLLSQNKDLIFQNNEKSSQKITWYLKIMTYYLKFMN